VEKLGAGPSSVALGRGFALLVQPNRAAAAADASSIASIAAAARCAAATPMRAAAVAAAAVAAAAVDRARGAARRAQPFCGIHRFSEQELAGDDAIRAR